MAKYHQGRYTPKNPEKYVGDVNNIVFRSSWEKKFLLWADSNPSVLKYGSEEFVVKYMSPVDMREHRYFVDFVIMVKTRSGEIKKYAVEIKPEAQTLPPVTKNKKRLLTETMTYAVNQAKWAAADKVCRKIGMEFIVLTEKHLKV
jgi:hypothetical protein